MSTNDATERADSIRRNTFFSFAVQLTTSAFTAGLTLFLVRALGPGGYGAFALALAVGGLVLLPADLGLTSSAARFIAEHRDDRGAVRIVVAVALKLKIAAAAVVSVALALLAGPIASVYGEHGLVWPLRGMAISLFGQSVMFMVLYAFVAQGKVASNFRIVLVESFAEAGASIAFVLLGAGATGAAFGRAVGYIVGAALAVTLILRVLGPSVLAPRFFSRRRARQLVGYAGALTAIDAAWTLFTKIDSLLIGAFLNAASVGLYQAPLRLTTVLNYPGLAVANGVAPRLARQRGGEPDMPAFLNALRSLVVFHAALIAPLLVWAEPIVHLLLGTKYGNSAQVLRALVPYILLSGLAPLLSGGVNYLGEARRRVPIAIATVGANVVLDVVLIPRIGIIAGAIATDTAFAIYVFGHIWVCTRVTQVSFRPLLATGVRASVASGAMALLLLAVGTGALSPVQWLVGMVVGPVVFAVVLLAMGEVSRRELNLARGFLMRLLVRESEPA